MYEVLAISVSYNPTKNTYFKNVQSQGHYLVVKYWNNLELSSAKLSRVEFSSDWIWFILEYLGLIWSSLVWHTFLTKLNMLFLYYMVLKSLIADTPSMSRLYVQFLCSGSKLRLNAQVLCARKNCSGSVFRLNTQSQCSGSILGLNI